MLLEINDFLQKTATKAVVEMAMNQTIKDGGFHLLILLAELHVPRMWVERHPDDPDSRVCYLRYFIISFLCCPHCIIYVAAHFVSKPIKCLVCSCLCGRNTNNCHKLSSSWIYLDYRHIHSMMLPALYKPGKLMI